MIQHISPGPLMSQAVIHNKTVTLSGQIAIDDQDADFATQTRAIFARIDSLLAEAGTDRSHMISANIWITDAGNFGAFNDLWTDWLNGAIPPARATVVSALVLPSLKIEIQVSAAIP
ncbi:RidA family protein [Thalassococcus sp. S3]|uniref:RidA family protein n=1 Tax=Thalassococcus sp. S3 TaxID=2017482 RepID=UPI0010241D06|nr:RidA family protein [Thalassococcus sp. S3]QBF33471.1 hypothetical protein CFI11_19980 [Thalassococcus sp. S3]